MTVYLLSWEDFCESKGNNSYLQPSKALYQTTVRFEDLILSFNFNFRIDFFH